VVDAALAELMAAEGQIMGALDAADHDQLTHSLRLLLAFRPATVKPVPDGELIN
jgi:hypothetical protein